MRRNLAKLLGLIGGVAALVAYYGQSSSPGSAGGDCCRSSRSLLGFAQQLAFAQRKDLVPNNTSPLGGDIMPARQVADPYPAFNGIAIDTENNRLIMTDANRKSILAYDRAAAANKSSEPTPMLKQIIGPQTNIGFVTGVAVDPGRREIYAVNNDIEDTMLVMPYDAEGNWKPTRLLSVPHQAWGLALSGSRHEIAVSVEIHNAIVVYRSEANGVEPPERYIRGPDTELADPHGVYWDERHNEIGVANHGNFRGLVHNLGSGCVPTGTAEAEGGKFQPPSITIYPATAKGNRKPLRTIQGAATQLDWPMGLAVDAVHDEIAVANNGDNSVLIFERNHAGNYGGNIAPVRVIRGDRTGIDRPMGIAIDTKNDEIWVSNFGGHTAVAFARSANGNEPPKRVIRSAPAGAPAAGFGNPMALAYDSKRQQVLAPN